MLVALALILAISTPMIAQSPLALLSETRGWPGWTRGFYGNVFVQGNIGYACGDGLHIFDVSDPAQEVHLGSWPSRGGVRSVCVVGGIAYVVIPDYGLWIVDVADVRNPVTLGSLGSLGIPLQVVVRDQIAYLAAQDSYVNGVLQSDGGLHVIDVRNPSLPVRLATSRPGGGATEVLLLGTNAYLGSNQRVFILDVADPSSPVLRGQIDSQKNHLAVQGSHLLVASESAALKVYSIADPYHPILTDSVMPAAQRIAVESDLVIVSYENGLSTYSLSGNGKLEPLGGLSGFRVTDLTVANHRAYCANSGFGLTVVDLTNPAAPIKLGLLGVPVNTTDVRVVGSVVYAIESTKGSGYSCELQILNAADPTQLMLLGNCKLPGWGYRLVIDGHRAYVQTGDRSIEIVDIADPKHPFAEGTYTSANNLWSWTATATRLYTSANDGQLRVTDVTAATQPRLLGSFSHTAYGMELAGGRLYTSGGRLSVLDVSNPARIRINGSYYYGRWSSPEPIAVSGGRAFIGSNGDGYYANTSVFQVFDVTDISQPTYLGNCASPVGTLMTRIEISKNLAFVSRNRGGIEAIYLGDPRAPLSLFRYVPGSADEDVEALATDGSWLYVANEHQGVRIYKMAEPQIQSIQFAPITSQYFPGPGLMVRAQASSGLPVTLSLVGGPAFLQGWHLTLTGPGSVTLRAEQSGGGSFLPASAQTTFAVIEKLPDNPRFLTGQMEYNQFVLLWPAASSELLLESTTQLVPSSWASLSNKISTLGSYNRMAIPWTNAQRFFRLRP